MSVATRGEATRLMWVRVNAGQPRVRWGRVAAFLGMIAAVNLVGAAIVSWFTDIPINRFPLLAPLCVAAAYLVLAVELQRQRLRYGQLNGKTWSERDRPT